MARVTAGSITLTEAVPLLGVSYREAKRLWRRYRAGGAAALVYGNVGQRSNRAQASAEPAEILTLNRTQYSRPVAEGPGQRVGPTLVAEHLFSDHGILVARSTPRDWMREAGLWSRARRAPPAHTRCERVAHFGELVQLDGSFHDWFEGRGLRSGRRNCLMTLVDYATSTTLVQFGAEETIWAAVGVLRAWITAYGVPRALYTDWKNVYKRAPTLQGSHDGRGSLYAVRRMCQKLDIAIISIYSSARGRKRRSVDASSGCGDGMSLRAHVMRVGLITAVGAVLSAIVASTGG